MAKDKNNIKRIRDNDGVELLVQQLELHTDNEVVLRAGGRLLAKVAEGDLAKMIERLQNGNLSEAAKLLAIGLISNLALQPENIAIIIEKGGIEALLKNFENMNPKTQAAAARAIQRIAAKDPAVVDALVANGAIPKFVQALSNPDASEELLTATTQALREIASNSPKHAELVNAEGGVQAVLTALKKYPDYDKFGEAGFDYIESLCKVGFSQGKLLDMGAVESIISMMRANPLSSDLHLRGFRALLALTSYEDVEGNKSTAERILLANGTKVLADSIHTHATVEAVVKAAVATFLQVLTLVSKARDHVLKSNGINCIVKGIFIQYQQEFLGKSLISRDADYESNVKNLLSLLVNKKDIAGLAGSLNRIEPMMKVAVFAKLPAFVDVMIRDKIGPNLATAMRTVAGAGDADSLKAVSMYAMDTWSIARSGRAGLDHLMSSKAVETMLSTIRAIANNADPVHACLRALMVFASSSDTKLYTAESGCVDTCVVAMRSNPTAAHVATAAIDVQIALATTDDLASSVLFKGGIRQINKMINENSISPQFEQATERGLVLIDRVASVRQSSDNIRNQLVKQGTIAAVTSAMSAYTANERIEEVGGRILAKLYDQAGVEGAIEEMERLVAELKSAHKPEKILQNLARSMATVGFLSLNKDNLDIMEKKSAAAIAVDGLQTIGVQDWSPARELARRNGFRALGQLGSIRALPSKLKATQMIVAALNSSNDQVTLNEKVGVLNAIKYLANVAATRKDLISGKVIESICKLLADNSSDEAVAVACLDALASLTKGKQGIQAAVKAGAKDLVLDILKNNAETMTPAMAEGCLRVLSNIASLSENVQSMDEDGIIDAVNHALDKQCYDSLNPYPAVLGAAASVFNHVAHNGNMAARVVNKGSVAKVIKIANSTQAYQSDAACMQSVATLLANVTSYEPLREKVAKLPGVVALLTEAMDENGQDDALVAAASKALVRMLGSNPETLSGLLDNMKAALSDVNSNPKNPALLDKLLKSAKNVSNLALIEGVVTPQIGKPMTNLGMDSFEVVTSKVPDGALKADVVATSLQIVGRTAQNLDNPGAAIDTNRAIPLLVKAIKDNSNNPAVQIEALKALGNLVEKDEAALMLLAAKDGIKVVEDVLNNTTDPNVRAAAQAVLKQFNIAAMKNPAAMVTDRLGADAIAQLLSAIDDPGQVQTFLHKLTDNNNGTRALLALIGTPAFRNMSPELRTQVFNALAEMNGLVLDPEHVAILFQHLKNATGEERVAILNLLGKPKVSKNMLNPQNMKDLLALLNSDEIKKDPAALLAALQALAHLTSDDDMAKMFFDLGGGQTVMDILKDKPPPEVIAAGVQILNKGRNLPGGPKGMKLGPEHLPQLSALLTQVPVSEKDMLNGVIDDLTRMYAGEGAQMIPERIDNALLRLAEANGIQVFTDPKTGKPYFVDKNGNTTWEMPLALDNAKQALMAIAKTAEQNPEMVPQISADQLNTLVNEIHEHNNEPLRLIELAKALAALAVNDANRNAMIKAGVLQAILKALEGDNLDRDFIIAALNLLNQFAKNKAFKEKICQLGGIAAIIAIMLKWIADDEIVEKCLKLLSNLAFNSKMCVTEIMKQKGPKAVKKVIAQHAKQPVVLIGTMSLLTNLMYKSERNKDYIGSLLGKEIVMVLGRHYKNIKLFKQTARTLGSIAWVDKHIRFAVDNQATKYIVQAINHHKGNIPAQQLAIDVLGNLASIDEEKDEKRIISGEIQSVHDIMLVEGGPKKIIDVVSETLSSRDEDPALLVNGMRTLTYMAGARKSIAERLIQMGIVGLALETMQKYDWDEEITGESMKLIAHLCYYELGSLKVYDADGVRIILTQMETHAEEPEFALHGAEALKLMSKMKPARLEIAKNRGVEVVIDIMEKNMEAKDLIRQCLLLLTPLCHEEQTSREIAQQGMRVVLQAITRYKDDTEVLIPAFQLIGHLAFTKENLKIIVQFGGIGLLIDAVLTHPEEFQMVERSIKTLDNVAMASPEHSKIVIDAGGKKTINEVMAAYEGTGHEELVNTCKGALLSMTEIETRVAKKRHMFDDLHALPDQNRDPLANYRNTLLTGSVMGLLKGGSKKEKHFRITKDWSSLQWKDPKKPENKKDSVAIKDLRSIKKGHEKFTKAQQKKTDVHKSFSIVTILGDVISIEAKTAQDAKLWAAALTAVKGADAKWLK